MPVVKANPNEFLVVGRGGNITNLGTAVQKFLWPGTVYVLVPSTRQETAFELTQESKDGIPLRFKGIVLYRIVDPVAAAAHFDFTEDCGLEDISELVNHICMGELRAVVSHMTMNECIEQRKTTLSSTIDQALRSVTESESGGSWGIEVELAQVAQVFIVDNELRRQLEAQVRNEIRVRSDQSDLRSREEIQTAQIGSERRLQESRQEAEKESLRRKEEMEMTRLGFEKRMEQENLKRKEESEMARIAFERRLEQEKMESERQEVERERERVQLKEESERQQAELEAPVKLLKLQNERQAAAEELELNRLLNQIHALEVERDMLVEQARQELRKELLPLEQSPAIAQALAEAFQGMKVTMYGQENALMPLLAPLMDELTERLRGNGKAK